MTRALARIQGVQEARADTAKLEASPTPPPHSTKRAKAPQAPGADRGRIPAPRTASAVAMTPPP
ncbi:hypothetical protein GCM10009801_73760 [Streptomyces albiaxialis]|uniref:Uncharacterized protein n=1 Tax=Streptomyces albiaxialis TaxID=329523 RepID=A0ABN2WZW5_9ACTN